MITRLAALRAIAASGLALSMSAGSGVALADPLDPAINVNCSYSALNAQSPAVAQQFNASPMAQAWVRTFFASPPNKRQQMAQQAQSVPGAQQYVGLVLQIADTCNNY